MIGIALATRGLVKSYGHRRALDGFTLSVQQGAIMGLVGPNGSGKTTWMMTVAGFLIPSSGSVDILGSGPFDAVRHSGRLSILPQDSALPLEARLDEILFRYARMQGLPPDAARRSCSEALAAVNLSDRAHASIRSLSHGMRTRARIAQCFLGSPELVLLDEPLNGLDPVEADRIRRFLLSRRGGQTIVITSHNLHDVEALCTHVAFVEKGRVKRTTTIADVTRSASRVVYRLSSKPGDMAAISAALPGAVFEWLEDECALACSFSGEEGGAAAAKRMLLPVLLAQTDIIGVSSGISLEQAYLGEP